MRRLLGKITLIAAQNEEDAARFIALGLKRKPVCGNGQPGSIFPLPLNSPPVRSRCVASGPASSGLDCNQYP